MQIVRTGTSLYLLKPGTRTAVEKKFDDRVPLENGISGWFHFIEAQRKEPAWLRALQPYLGSQVHYDTRGGLPAGIALVERKDANYLLTFGHAWIQLDPLWLEPDFGRRVALNAVPPNKVLELNSEQVFARWHVAKERSPKATNFQDFGVALDRDLVAALEGVPSDPLFGGVVRGSTSLRVKIHFPSLPSVLDKTLALFSSDAYKKRWPEIDNLTPIAADAEIAELDTILDDHLKAGRVEASGVLFAPSFRKGEMESADSFVIGRLSKNPPITPYLEYSFWKQYLLGRKDVPSLATAKATKVHMLDMDHDAFEARSVYDCLGYELAKDGTQYILSSGLWYRADTKFVKGIVTQLNRLSPSDITLPNWDGVIPEDEYNEACSKLNGMFLFDRKIVHYGGDKSKFEFCDFMHHKKKTLFFAKVASRSSGCSHLVEQVKRTIELLFSADPGFRAKLKKSIELKSSKLGTSWLDSRPRPGEWRLCLVLMGKTKAHLPLFARCSISRLAKHCDEHGHELLVTSV